MMTDDILTLVPRDPRFFPPPESLERFGKLLRDTFPYADEVSLVTVDGIEVVDSGQAPEQIGCPRCDKPLSIPWWQQAIRRLEAEGLGALLVELPCCGAEVGLHDLTYDEPVGFAQFLAEVFNPGASRWPRDDEDEARLQAMAKALGTPLQVIRNWA